MIPVQAKRTYEFSPLEETASVIVTCFYQNLMCRTSLREKQSELTESKGCSTIIQKGKI